MKRCSFFLFLLLFPGSAVRAQPRPKPATQPRVTVVAPLGAASGTTMRLTIRGLKLDAATAVRFRETKATAKILKKGAVAVPNQQALDKVGNTQIEVDVTLPADVPEGSVPFVVVTPAGITSPHRLLVSRPGAVVKEKEPNGGFLQAQPLTVPGAVDGVIARNQDVDVYRFQGKAGQKLVLRSVGRPPRLRPRLLPDSLRRPRRHARFQRRCDGHRFASGGDAAARRHLLRQRD